MSGNAATTTPAVPRESTDRIVAARHWPALHLISVQAKAAQDMRDELENLIRQAWQQRIPTRAIAIAAGYTDEAAVRMLAKRRGWRR